MTAEAGAPPRAGNKGVTKNVEPALVCRSRMRSWTYKSFGMQCFGRLNDLAISMTMFCCVVTFRLSMLGRYT